MPKPNEPQRPTRQNRQQPPPLKPPPLPPHGLPTQGRYRFVQDLGEPGMGGRRAVFIAGALVLLILLLLLIFLFNNSNRPSARGNGQEKGGQNSGASEVPDSGLGKGTERSADDASVEAASRSGTDTDSGDDPVPADTEIAPNAGADASPLDEPGGKEMEADSNPEFTEFESNDDAEKSLGMHSSDGPGNEQKAVPDEEANLNRFAAGEQAQYQAAVGGGQSLSPLGTGKVSFFGMSAPASHVGFVIDKSSSMAGRRWNQVTKQLIDSVKNMEPGQQFSIWLFDAQPTFDSEFISCKVTPANTRKLERWIETVWPGGSTYPDSTMKLAFQEKCDVIFLLSDGEFSNPENITRINRKKVPVYTVSMGVDSRTLKQIAKENDGKYRFIR